MKKTILLLLTGLLAASCGNQPAQRRPVIAPLAAPAQNNKTMMTLTSSAFKAGESIPKKYTCQGEGINPPMEFSGVPAQTKSMALVMDDPDVPKNLKPDGVFDHWVVFNISPGTTAISKPGGSEPLGIMGKNSRGETSYAPPCPPDGKHRYFFRLYALDTVLSLREGAAKAEVLSAMTGHILQQAELMGTYVKD